MALARAAIGGILRGVTPAEPRELLEATWLGISGLDWSIMAASLVTATPILLVVRAVAVGRLRALARRSQTDVDDLLVDLLAGTRAWFLALAVLRATSLALALPVRWDRAFALALGVALALQGALWGATVVRFAVDRRFRRHAEAGGGQVVPVAQTLLRFAGLVVVWSLAALVTLANLGVDITALVAGLGIGGVAVALAVQRVLGDVLASISIAVDKPFQPGDFIAVGDQMGTVQRVGLRSTLLAGLGGEGLVFSNDDLLSSRIRNFARMQERRVAFRVGVLYDTPVSALEAMPEIVRGCVEGREKVRFERASLINLAESALEFEVVYWVLDPDFQVYARIHEQVLLELVRRLRAAGCDFAFPTRTIHLERPPLASGEGLALGGGAGGLALGEDAGRGGPGRRAGADEAGSLAVGGSPP